MSSARTFLFRAALVLGLAAAALPALHAQPAAGGAFPRLADFTFEGELPATAGRVLVIDFWASWCAPCKAAFPALAKLHADYAARGVTLVGVSVDEKAAAYASFLKRHQPPFATVRDASQKFVAAVKIPTLPTTVVVGRDGRVRAVFSGYHGAATEEPLRAALDQALAESAP